MYFIILLHAYLSFTLLFLIYFSVFVVYTFIIIHFILQMQRFFKIACHLCWAANIFPGFFYEFWFYLRISWDLFVK